MHSSGGTKTMDFASIVCRYDICRGIWLYADYDILEYIVYASEQTNWTHTAHT